MIRTLGCSLTYGHGLKDCKSPGNMTNPKPSAYAWPKVIEEIANTEVKNHSRFGASIKYCSYVATERIRWRENDVAIFLWPNKLRSSTITSAGRVSDIGHWASNKLSKYMVDSMEKYSMDSDFDAVFNIIGTDLILKQKGVQCFHLCNNVKLDTNHQNDFELKTNLPQMINVIDKEDQNFDILLIAKRLNNYGADGSHPGIESHRLFGKLVYKKIKDNII